MQDTFLILVVVLFAILASVFVYFGVMIIGNDRTTKAIRDICFLLAVLFLFIGGLVAYLS